MAKAAAKVWEREAHLAVNSRGTFRAALSGGKSPRELFKQLSRPEFASLPWNQTEIFWIDERYVPADHPESNYRSAHDEFLKWVPLGSSAIHPIPTYSSLPQRDAQAYEDLLRSVFPHQTWPTMDLCLLGIGLDGHAASLFPNDGAISSASRWVIASESPRGIRERITLSLPALNASRLKLFLVSGHDKRSILKTVLGPMKDPPLPAQLLWHNDGPSVLISDRNAFAQLPLEIKG